MSESYQEQENRKLQALKEDFYSNRLFPIDDRRIPRGKRYDDYCTTIYRMYWYAAEKGYFLGRFKKRILVRDEKKGSCTYKQVYPQDIRMFERIFSNFFLRLRTLQYANSYFDTRLLQKKPENKYEREALKVFQKKLQEKDIPGMVEQQATALVRELLVNEVNKYIDKILGYYLDTIEKQFQQLLRDIDVSDQNTSQYRQKEEMLHEIYSSTISKTQEQFAVLKQELIERIIP